MFTGSGLSMFLPTSGQTLVVNVTDLGPVSTSADSAGTIQKALNTVAAVGQGTVWLDQPARIDSQLVIASDNIKFLASSWGAYLIAGAAFPINTPMLKVAAPGGAGNFRYGIVIGDLFLNGNNIAGVGGIELDSTYGALLDNVRVRYCPGTGIYLTDPSLGGARGAYTTIRKPWLTDGGAGTAILTYYAENNTVDGGLISFYNSAGGVGIKCQDGGNTFSNIQFDECNTSFWDYFAHSNQFTNNNLGRAVSRHVYLNGAQNCIIAGNYFDQCVGSPSPAAVIYADNNQNQNNIIAHNTCIGTSGWTYGYYEAGGIGVPGNELGPNMWNGLRQQIFTGVPA